MVQFGALNWAVVIVYLLAVLGVGIYFTRRASESTDSFFRAGGRIPAWAAGFSIYATTLSAITYMSTPEQAFLTDWSYGAGNLSIFAIVPLLIYFYIPFFRKLNVTTAYEYLEARFGVSIRVLGSMLFVLFHIGRTAIVVYLPTLAITSVTDINPLLIALVVGALCVLYTLLGGMEGVIWSDVIQGIILLAGAALIIVFGIASITGGLGTVTQDALADDKFITAASWTGTGTAGAAIWLIFVGNIFNSLYQYTGSQDVVQRYQTTASVEDTARSLIINGILALVTIPLFYGMGTVLYSYYKQNAVLPEGFNTSAIVPYFVVTVLPAGVAGVIIAAIFAAAQSTVSSSLNSISACIATDIKDRFSSGPKSTVLFSRIVILVAGTLGVGVSLYLLATNQDETWNLFLAVMGLFGVPIAAIFALGIFTRRASTIGVAVGLVAATAIAFVLRANGSNPFIISSVAFVATMVIGYLASFIAPASTRNVVGLTIHTRSQDYTGTTAAAVTDGDNPGR